MLLIIALLDGQPSLVTDERRGVWPDQDCFSETNGRALLGKCDGK
jgi:hypothetical protein